MTPRCCARATSAEKSVRRTRSFGARAACIALAGATLLALHGCRRGSTPKGDAPASGEVGGGAGGSGPDLDAFAHAYARVVCERELRPCCESTYDAQACLATMSSAVSEAFAPGRQGGPARYEPAAGAACLAAASAAPASCRSTTASSPIAAPPLEACVRVLDPRAAHDKGPGERCSEARDCALSSRGPSLCGQGPGSDVDTCTLYVHGRAGDPCGDAPQAPGIETLCLSEDGVRCNKRLGHCEPQHPIGGRCSDSADCVEGAFCADQRCRAAAVSGEPCVADDPRQTLPGRGARRSCKQGACDPASHQCAPRRPARAACTSGSQCESDVCEGAGLAGLAGLAGETHAGICALYLPSSTTACGPTKP